MRPYETAFVVLLLLLLFALVHASSGVEITGALSEAGDVGYFAIGNDTMLAVRPDSPEDIRLRSLTGQIVRVVVESQR